MTPPVRFLALLAIVIVPTTARALDRSPLVRTDPAGHLVLTPAPAPDSLKNPWPPDLEREFAERADFILRAQTAAKPPGVNTYFENEKRTYGFLMAHVLAGRSPDTSLKFLQAEDAQARECHRPPA